MEITPLMCFAYLQRQIRFAISAAFAFGKICVGFHRQRLLRSCASHACKGKFAFQSPLFSLLGKFACALIGRDYSAHVLRTPAKANSLRNLRRFCFWENLRACSSAEITPLMCSAHLQRQIHFAISAAFALWKNLALGVHRRSLLRSCASHTCKGKFALQYPPLSPFGRTLLMFCVLKAFGGLEPSQRFQNLLLLFSYEK